MTDKTPAQKGHIKPGTPVAVLNAVPGVIDRVGLAPDTPFVDASEAQLVILFVNTLAELQELMPSAVRALAPGASIWVLYRKGSKSAGLDMNRDNVWAIAEQMDLRPLGLVSIDESWSAFRLRPAV